MHQAGYAALGLPYVYVPFRVSDDLEGALRGMRALGIRGFGVSMPFKIQVLPLLDRLDDLAAHIGAVNTVVNDGGCLTGFNTDAEGALAALSEARSVAGARVLVVGAGGAARAVAFSLTRAGARLHLANRSPERASALATELRGAFGCDCDSSGLPVLARAAEFDVLLNASSAGMQGYGDLELPDQLPDVVMDIVYKPLKTRLIARAEQRGARTVSGGRMLLHQAAAQFRLYTGKVAPMHAMERALAARS